MGIPAVTTQPEVGKVARFLITVNVIGSAGPIRFVVREGELVKAVIATVLKSYYREGRLPMIGFDANEFLLYTAGSEELRSGQTISSSGCRSFFMCKKNQSTVSSPSRRVDGVGKSVRSDGKWKSRINKFLSFKIASH